MERHEFERDLKAAFDENDLRGRAKMLGRLMVLGLRSEGRETVSLSWAILIVPPLLAAMGLGLYLLGGVKLAGAGVILGYLLVSQVILRPQMRRARDEQQQFEKRLLDQASEVFLSDRTKSRGLPQRGNLERGVRVETDTN